MFFFADSQSMLVERFGERVVALTNEQVGEIVLHVGHEEVLRAEGLLAYRQRTLVKWLRLSVLGLSRVNIREQIETRGYIDVVDALGSLR